MPPKLSDKSSPSLSARENLQPQSTRARPQNIGSLGLQIPATTMATQIQTSTSVFPLQHQRTGAIQLPSLRPIHSGNTPPRSLPIPTASVPLDPGVHLSPHSPYTPSAFGRNPWNYFPNQGNPPEGAIAPASPAGSMSASSVGRLEPLVPRKRSYDDTQSGIYGPPAPLHLLTPASIEGRDTISRTLLPPLSAHSSVSSASTPTGTTASFPLRGYPTAYSRQQSEASSSSISNRCTLFIRQQPRAARAGPDGKDRRNIDPPPVLQLMMSDFDPDSRTDLEEMKSTFYVVHCKLISPQSPRKDVSTQTSVGEDGSKEINRLLLGTLVASSFFCPDDPDPENMPQHPMSAETAPPSPSSRFIQTTSRKSPALEAAAERPKATTLPGAFFIFPDLSVRKAGEYRLEFTMMKISPSNLFTGGIVPMIHSVASDVFRVVNAKDFDQVHPSTNLVKGLLERGAGFPLKLKKGIREGQRRRILDEEEDGGSVGEGDNDER